MLQEKNSEWHDVFSLLISKEINTVRDWGWSDAISGGSRKSEFADYPERPTFNPKEPDSPLA